VWEGRIVVTDAARRSDEQIFFVNVVPADTPNAAPVIRSNPRERIQFGGRHSYDVTGSRQTPTG
jgi:hypothetical protein